MSSKTAKTNYLQKINMDVIDAEAIEEGMMVLSNNGVFVVGKGVIGNIGKDGEFYGEF